MKNKRHIFLFIIWTISCANSVPTNYRYISKTRFPEKPRYTTTWAFNFPNPGGPPEPPGHSGPFGPLLHDLAQFFKNPMSFPYPNNFYPSPSHPSHNYPNYEYHPPQYPHESHQKPQVTNFIPESPIMQEHEKVQPPSVEVESSTVKEVNNQKPNLQIETQEFQSNNNAILIDSLNKALDKLNKLLPSKSNTEKDNKNISAENASSQDPSMIKPEVLADSLNKAIDTLSEVLAMKPLNTQNVVTSPPFFMGNPIIHQQQMTLSLESAIEELEKLFMRLPDELKNPQGPNNPGIIGIGQFHPIFVPRPIVSNGIPTMNPIIKPEETDRPTQEITTTEPVTLFTSSAKNKDKQTTTTESSTLFTSSNNLFTSSNNLFTSSKKDKNKNKGMQSTTPMSSESNESFGSFESNESFGSFGSNESFGSFGSSESSEEDIGLFTSLPNQKNKTETDTTPASFGTEDALFTSSTKDMLFTSSPKKPLQKIDTNQGTENINDILSTSAPSETTTEIILTGKFKDDEELATTEAVSIDIRFGNEPSFEDSIVFPDEFDEVRVPDRISPSFIHENELNLASRFGETNSSKIKPHANDNQNSGGFMLPVQNPFLIISDKNSPQNNLINLEYNPQRPSFQPEPLVYPMPVIPHGEPLPGSSTERNNFQQLGDRNNVPSTTTQRIVTSNQQTNTPISLEYKPSRPPFAPNPVVYPMPFVPPGRPLPGTSTERNNQQQLGDRNSVPTTTTQRIVTSKPNQNTPISLEYEPMRPFFAPNPVVYPRPIIPPGDPLPGSSTERNNHQQLGDRNNVPSTTTQKITDENTPISLEYKPSRPPFAPNPVVYPMPGNFQELGDRNQVPTTTTTPRPTTRSTRRPYTNTPIVLGYKPSRPPYVPEPWIYPSPGLIPPGTPWPASSTERPFGK